MRHCYLIVLIVFTISSVWSQEYGFTHFTMQDGLSQMKANSILKDSKGYIWIGTRNGLNRFDVHNFEVFTKEDGLLHNRIHGLAQYKNGSILIMTFDGINVFDGEKFKSFPFSFSKVIYETVMDCDGLFWILGDTGQLWTFDQKEIREIWNIAPKESPSFRFDENKNQTDT